MLEVTGRSNRCSSNGFCVFTIFLFFFLVLDYIQCPYCQRRFSENAAERHIKFCKEQASRISNKGKFPGNDKAKPPSRTQVSVSERVDSYSSQRTYTERSEFMGWMRNDQFVS